MAFGVSNFADCVRGVVAAVLTEINDLAVVAELVCQFAKYPGLAIAEPAFEFPCGAWPAHFRTLRVLVVKTIGNGAKQGVDLAFAVLAGGYDSLCFGMEEGRVVPGL